jgi:PAS domain S-box-containing protein
MVLSFKQRGTAMDLHQIKNLEAVIISAISIIGAIWAFLKWVWPYLKNGYERTIAVFRIVEQMPTVLESMQSVDTLSRQVSIIMKQVMPDGGSSLADSMKRIETTVSDNAKRSEATGKNVALMTATMRATSNTNPRMATFETSSEGLLVDCNKTYLRWTGKTLNEMLNWGWINTVHPDDRDMIRREWNQAVVDVRQSIHKYRMLDEDGACFYVEVTATPIPEGSYPCEKWVGVIYLDQMDQRERPISCQA